MFELSLHILDLVQNSVTAGASLIIVTVTYRDGVLTITIEDDGCGMDQELLERVTSPFATTRTTRKVGLGIPMFKQLAEMCAGSFTITSEKGKGTRLTATFAENHVDLPPLGDLVGTFTTLINSAPEKPDFRLEYNRGDSSFAFDTREIRTALGNLPLDSPEIIGWISDYLSEGIAEADVTNKD